MGIFKWRGRVSRAEFRKRFIAAIALEAPQLRCVGLAEDDLAFRIEGAGPYREVNVSLDRAYAEFERDPKKCDDVLAHWLLSIEHLWKPQQAIDKADIVPMVKHRSWIETNLQPGEALPARDSAGSFWYDDYNDELIVVYAVHRDRYAYPPRSELLEAGATPGDIRALALSNLRARTPDRSLGTLNGVWMVNAGGGFEASLLIDSTMWDDARLRDHQRLIVAVPERDGLLANAGDSAGGVWNLAVMAAHGTRTQPYPISSQLFVRHGARFEVLDPRLQDDGHPIPALDVLDLTATLRDATERYVIVIATPLENDPRSAFRLFRKLDGYLLHIAATRQPDTKIEIEVNIHSGSHPEYFVLLAGMGEYVASRGAKLVVKKSE